MLKIRLIPTLLLRNGRCIKTRRFNASRDTGDPVAAAKVYDAQGADELLFLDINASNERREILINVIERVADECFMPLTVGGGIRTIDDIQRLLKIGADKVAVCTAFVENPDFVNVSSRIFGISTIIGVITYRFISNQAKVVIHGKETETPLKVVSWAKELEARGAGELFLYSIDRDGMMKGYDLDLLEQVAESVSIPVIACGGAGSLDDFVKAVRQGNVSAVSAGSIFHFTDQNLIKARAHMKNAGLDVRSV